MSLRELPIDVEDTGVGVTDRVERASGKLNVRKNNNRSTLQSRLESPARRSTKIATHVQAISGLASRTLIRHRGSHRLSIGGVGDRDCLSAEGLAEDLALKGHDLVGVLVDYTACAGSSAWFERYVRFDRGTAATKGGVDYLLK